jgi:phage terminase small subunit
MALTKKQLIFADEFIITGNARKSAIKAGYSKKTAKEIGCENLTKPNIKKYIDDIINEQNNERVASRQEVLETLTNALRGNINNIFILKAIEHFVKIYFLRDIKDDNKDTIHETDDSDLFKDDINDS